MSGEGKGKGVLLTAITWLVIAGIAAVAYKYFFVPKEKEKLRGATGSDSQYKHEIRLAADSFSGYCLLRSEALQERMRKQGVRLNIEDDGADYAARMKALKKGRVDLAVFTIDSFLAAGAELGEFPGTIVMIIDETRGADAMVAYQSGLASLSDLNRSDARIVLTPSSPSEFLARIGIAHFNLPELPANWMQEGDGAAAVFKHLKKADRKAPNAYVLWEPFVSQALALDGVIVLLDSGKLSGYIVDVLVARRDFLQEEPERVQGFVEAYLRTAYAYRDALKMSSLVVEDAKDTGTRGIKQAQAEQMVQGIAWKNTLENFAHFGLVQGAQTGGLPHIEDMIGRITDVLLQTGALSADPLDGQATSIFYDRILRKLQDSGFHPGKELNLIGGSGADIGQVEQVVGHAELPALSEAQWAGLIAVGEMKIPPLSFGRGGARLHLESQRNLSKLADVLASFPHYYVKILGQTRAEGDPEANKALAAARAKAAFDFLVEKGVNPNRLADSAQPSSGGAAAQAVSFVIGQQPY